MSSRIRGHSASARAARTPTCHATRLQDIESDTGYDTRRCLPDVALARLSQTTVYDTC